MPSEPIVTSLGEAIGVIADLRSELQAARSDSGDHWREIAQKLGAQLHAAREHIDSGAQSPVIWDPCNVFPVTQERYDELRKALAKTREQAQEWHDKFDAACFKAQQFEQQLQAAQAEVKMQRDSRNLLAEKYDALTLKFTKASREPSFMNMVNYMTITEERDALQTQLATAQEQVRLTQELLRVRDEHYLRSQEALAASQREVEELNEAARKASE